VSEENVWTEKVQVFGGRRELHNEESRNLYTSPSIIKMVESISVNGIGHVACMEKKDAYKCYCVGQNKGSC
jgi:hypothetical protein